MDFAVYLQNILLTKQISNQTSLGLWVCKMGLSARKKKKKRFFWQVSEGPSPCQTSRGGCIPLGGGRPSPSNLGGVRQTSVSQLGVHHTSSWVREVHMVSLPFCLPHPRPLITNPGVCVGRWGAVFKTWLSHKPIHHGAQQNRQRLEMVSVCASARKKK